jgi:DNA-binding MarR family transcriptional regulator
MEQETHVHKREPLASALVALHRYSVVLTEIAHQSLGRESTENRDIEVVLTLHRTGPMTPTELAEATGAPRSSVSRALNRLEAAGLITRRPDARDGRSVLIAVTPKGRRRVAAFAGRLESYFAAGEPLIKEAFDLLDVHAPAPGASRSADPMTTITMLSTAGAAFVADATEALEPFGVRESADRFTIALLDLYGTQRPTQIAHELRLTPSGTSGVLARMEAADVIIRRHDRTPGDRRAVVVELAARGRQAADAQLDVFARHVESLTQALSLTWRGE